MLVIGSVFVAKMDETVVHIESSFDVRHGR